jgi:endonuclease/exonuclease/phosphatase family metal-dependent hydrolase
MRSLLPGFMAGFFIALAAPAQILMSGGTNYSQNFDALATNGTANAWLDNSTISGWYASQSVSPGTVSVYRAEAGGNNTGALYSFGETASKERALGSISSGTPGDFAYGVRFTNDTALTATNLTISFTGEQWRNGGNTNAQKLEFSFLVSSTMITNADADWAGAWVPFTALDFPTPTTGASAGALAGNNPTNQQAFTNVILSGVAVLPGREIFLRWFDTNNVGNDHAVTVDDLTVSYQLVTPGPAETNPPPVVIVTNNSITLMTYNVKGNGTTDWSTNTAQVQAIGRQLMYLNPDVITFNEIPYTNTWQMTNWVTVFMPGYSLAMNSGTDGSIRSVIASRFPIIRSQSWLDSADLKPFGYTNTSSTVADNFTRDLFEAEINVPNWPLPLHVFTTHLKASSGTNYADNLAKRAAEAAAITNFFATNLFVLHPLHPFTLSGDMNEADTSQLSIQRLISTLTTLRLTNPKNPVSGSVYTYDSATPNGRIDYIFPCTLLFSNIVSSQVFRTDKLEPLPAGLLKYDSTNASDHLPVLLTFANPFNQPFKLLSFTRTNQGIALKWESATNRFYNVETSTNLTAWSTLATNLFATGTNHLFTTNNVDGQWKFFRIRRLP